MDSSAGFHGTIIVLLTILQVALRSCQDSLVPLAPINLEVHPDPLQPQRLLVQWDLNIHLSGLKVIFHIQVARSRKMNIIHEEFYNTTISGSGEPFSWFWDSKLPLECDSHSFRIRSTMLQDSFPSEQHWSVWSPWKTHYGKNEDDRTNIAIYPHEKIVLEGSDVTFCCLPGLSGKVQNMFYNKTKQDNLSQQMKTESFVITVKNVSITRSDGANVVCQVESKSKGNVLIVSRPPTEPQNFSCETNDLEKLQCTWRPGPMYNFYGPLAETYTLHEGLSGRSASCSRESCTWPIVRNQKIYHFTLNVKNILGERSIQAIVDLAERVRPLAPINLARGYLNATEVFLIWALKADYTTLLLRCQIDLNRNTVNVTVKGKKSSSEMYSVSLTDLQPFTKYHLRVRCMSESSFAGWSNWSDALIIHTPETAPSATLDVWREIHHNESGKTVTLYWKHPAGFRANGNITQYNIKWWPLSGNIMANNTKVSAHWNSYTMSLGTQAYVICITAQNGAGVSPEAQIRIPGTSSSSNNEVNTERTHGRGGEINVIWRPVPAVHGYVVQWCNFPRSPHCALQWKKYNSTIQGDVIHSESFQPGVRYNFWIYGSKEDGEHLVAKLTGYTEELVSTKKPKVVTTKIDANSLSLDWSPYPIDETQEGFVMGYTIYLKPLARNCELDSPDGHIILDGLEVCRFFIKDPKIMNATIHQLKANTEYQVAVVAVTGGGETDIEFTDASTQVDARAMVMPILILAIIVSVLAVILLILGYWNRRWLKDTCYPKIPKPNKSNALSFSSAKGPASINVLPDVTNVLHEVDSVCVMKKVDSGQDLEESDQLTDVMYSTIQKATNTPSTESSEMYFVESSDQGSPPNNQTPQELLCPPKSPTYLEFFNENYVGNSEDSYEENFGYKPQMGSTQLGQSTCEYTTDAHSQDIDLGTGHFLTIADFSASENEPVSPTSVNSTSFILKD